MGPRIKRSYFRRETLDIARDLLGKRLVKLEADGSRVSGLICESEAYIGTQDDACHAKSGFTKRNRSMWGPPGHTYIYFSYGMHWMLNLVTEPEGFPAAILLRGVFPLEGLDLIRRRRSGRPAKRWTDGPAKLCQAFAITGNLDGLDICTANSRIFIEQAEQIPDSSVTIGPRVGLNRVAEPWKSIPWRFRVPYEYFADQGG